MTTKREMILEEVEGVTTALLVYDRRDDKTLPVGSIEEAIRSGVVSIPEMVSRFRKTLINATS